MKKLGTMAMDYIEIIKKGRKWKTENQTTARTEETGTVLVNLLTALGLCVGRICSRPNPSRAVKFCKKARIRSGLFLRWPGLHPRVV
jgi:hypothetical protein